MSQSQPERSRTAAFAWVALCYAAATVVAVLVHGAVLRAGHGAIASLGAADLAATLAVFAFSVAFNNSSFYDPYWSVTPLLIAPALATVHAAPGVPAARQLLVTALVFCWGLRLTWNWIRGWEGLGHEDWRYVDLRRQTGRAYWLVSLTGLHLMPTVTVFLGCLPLVPALATSTAPLNHLDLLAALLTGGAVLLEGVADQQLRAFRLSNRAPGKILDSGVWSLCRHPNYLGEISFWWGLLLFGLAADPGSWRYGAGALWMVALFTLFSIPLIDKRSLGRRPGYAEHMRRVPALLPRPWKNRGA